jgi:SAM-dependent methyltransferase
MSTYALGHSDRELERLSAQSRMLEPFTRQLLQEAGLAPDTRVLDVGSGHGDVALLVRRLTGDAGEVIGVDTSAGAVAAATDRVGRLGITNVRFIEGNAAEMVFDRPFDAVVGRLVLMYSPDPLATLRKLIRHVRPGGLIVLQEFDVHGCFSFPPLPLYDTCVRWLVATFERTGADPRLGLKLFSLLTKAGLRSPSLRLDAVIAGGPDSPAVGAISEVIRSLLPAMEKFGIATADEVRVDTLPDRLRDEIVGGGGVTTSPTYIGAWSTTPG